MMAAADWKKIPSARYTPLPVGRLDAVGVAAAVGLVAGALVVDWLDGEVEGAAVADATDGTGLEVLVDAVPTPVGVPAHAAVSMIIAARTIDRFIVTILV